MKNSPFVQYFGLFALAIALTLTGGCEALRPKAAPQPAFYALDRMVRDASDAPRSPSVVSATAPTLIVSPPQASAGFDSQRIVYVREAHRLEYFANSEWVDTPARMLPPLIVAAVESGRQFRTVVPAPSAVLGDLRLDTQIVRLQQDFGGKPSLVRFTLRATMVDATTRKVLASREFDQSVAAAADDPYGGVVAANLAVQRVLDDLAIFCNEAAWTWTRQ